MFQNIKDIDHPVVLHIHTIKGKGLAYAEQNRESWHAGGPFNVEDGSQKFKFAGGDTTLEDSIKNLMDTNPKAVAVNAGTPMGLGMVKGVREEYVKRGQFVYVGIAEENAMAMVSGIAKNGGTAVFGTFASFYGDSGMKVKNYGISKEFHTDFDADKLWKIVEFQLKTL